MYYGNVILRRNSIFYYTVRICWKYWKLLRNGCLSCDKFQLSGSHSCEFWRLEVCESRVGSVTWRLVGVVLWIVRWRRGKHRVTRTTASKIDKKKINVKNKEKGCCVKNGSRRVPRIKPNRCVRSSDDFIGAKHPSDVAIFWWTNSLAKGQNTTICHFRLLNTKSC